MHHAGRWPLPWPQACSPDRVRRSGAGGQGDEEGQRDVDAAVARRPDDPPAEVGGVEVREGKLLRRARHARRVASTNPCLAVKDLSAYRKTLRGARIRPSVKGRKLKAKLRHNLTDLGPASLQASRKLLTDKRTAKCGGGIVPSNLKGTKTSVLASNESGMKLRVQLPALRFVATDGGGKSWTKLVLPDTDAPGAPGTPGIPVASNILAVPDGATMQVKATGTESYTLDGVDVYPVQPETVDQAPGLAPKPNFLAGPFSDTGFKQDKKTYATDALIPAAPAFGKALGQARDLNIAGLHVPAAQFDPKTDKLKVLTQVDVDVTFVGGTKTLLGRGRIAVGDRAEPARRAAC